jgi:hypothetical protein
MTKDVLKKFGINRTIFTEIFNATMNHSYELTNNVTIFSSRFMHFLAKFNNPLKVEKVLTKNNIIYIANLRMVPSKHTFKCKLSDDSILTFEVDKQTCKSTKLAFELALIDFLSNSKILR